MIFKQLAKMTVENLSKSAKFCNRRQPIATRKWRLMTIPAELPQETRHFRVNPYISFRGKRGSNILGHHSRMMRKRGKNRL